MSEPRPPERVEQRRTPRRAAGLRCTLEDGFVERHTVLSDLSVGGARVATAGPPPIGRPISLTFELGDGRSIIEARGAVVWRSEGLGGRGGFVGIAFDELSEPAAVAAFVREG
jgi:hypothetical protein